jgi:hypothetical protein
MDSGDGLVVEVIDVGEEREPARCELVLGEKDCRRRDSQLRRANRAASPARSSIRTCRSEIRVPLVTASPSAVAGEGAQSASLGIRFLI